MHDTFEGVPPTNPHIRLKLLLFNQFRLRVYGDPVSVLSAAGCDLIAMVRNSAAIYV